MRLPFALLLAVHLPSSVAAQCCCAEHDVVIRTPQPAQAGGKWNYAAELHGERVDDHSHLDSVPGDPYRVVLRQHTGCGIAHAEWTLREANTRAEMRVNLYKLPGDQQLPAIVLPFVQGTTTYFDLREVLECTAEYGGRWNTFPTDSVLCSNGGRAIFTYDLGNAHRFEPQDIGPWLVPSGDAAPQGVRLDNASLSILPEEPRAGGSIHAHFQWFDGSCGRYKQSVNVMPKAPGAEVTEILISLGLEGENCADKARIHRTVELPHLAPGKYRIRIGQPPAGTSSVMGMGGWREFEVRP